MSLLKNLLISAPYTGFTSDAFRRSHDILGSVTGAQTDYQVKVKVCYNDNAIFDTIGVGNLADATGDRGAIGGYEGTNPVIPCGAGGTWDERIRETGNVLYEPEDTGREYKTWFSAYTGAYVAAGTLCVIGYAYSSDGINWTKVQCVGVAPDAAHGAEDPYIMKLGNTYYMYFELRDGTVFHQIARAYSTDCVNWTYEQVVLSLDLGHAWEDFDVASPINWIEDSTWYMIYEGRSVAGGGLGTIGMADSVDGLTWINRAQILGVGPAGKFDSSQTVPHDLVKIGSTYYLSYAGHDGVSFQQGMQSTEDFAAWNRLNDGNPIREGRGHNQICYDGVEYIFYYYEGMPDLGGIYRGYPDFRESVSLGGRCQTDFGDVRFMQDGTELDYWIEEQTDSSYALIWVEIATIPADPDSATIYIYYGKEGEFTASDGDATFDFFDDFETDLTKWTLTVTGGTVTLVAVPAPPEGTQCVELDDTVNSSPVRIEHYGLASRDYRVAYYVRANLEGAAQSIFFYWYDAPNNLQVSLALFGSFFQYFDVGWNLITAHAANTWYKIEYVFRLGDAPPHFDVWIDYDNNFPLLVPPLGVDLDMRALATATTGLFNGTASPSIIKGYFDVFRVGKYVSPEPTRGAWGSEEGAAWSF